MNAEQPLNTNIYNAKLTFGCSLIGSISCITFGNRIFFEVSPERYFAGLESGVYYDLSDFEHHKTASAIRMIIYGRGDLEHKLPIKHSFDGIKKMCELCYLDNSDIDISAVLSNRINVNIHGVQKNDDFIYIIDKVVYSEHFPLKWALSPGKCIDTKIIFGPGTSSAHCTNCNNIGGFHGVFIGYCINCSVYEYKLTRGYGFIDNGVELIKSADGKLAYPSGVTFETNTCVGEYKPAFETYLRNVWMENTGYYTKNTCFTWV